MSYQERRKALRALTNTDPLRHEAEVVAEKVNDGSVQVGDSLPEEEPEQATYQSKQYANPRGVALRIAQQERS